MDVVNNSGGPRAFSATDWLQEQLLTRLLVVESTYLPRHVDRRLSGVCAAFPIVVLDGPRAAGETTTAKRTEPESEVCADLVAEGATESAQTEGDG